MQTERRNFLLSTVAVAATCAACGGGGSGSSGSGASSSSSTSSSSASASSTSSATGLYPSYNLSPIPADSAGMASTAAMLASKITLAINIGNTLEAIGSETAWGNPAITQGLLNTYKSLGFDAVRIPCSWDQYADSTTAKISTVWLDRVKTVLQYCINANLYAVLNIHWDGGWLENHIAVADKTAVNAKQKAFWEQIATHLRDFDERIIFASANEPNADLSAGMDILMSYHQTFVDAVRSTGGKNAYRTLVVQGPHTDIDRTVTLWPGMPTDTVSGRLMLEVHYYSPVLFAVMDTDQSWGRLIYYWGTSNHSTIEPDRNATSQEENYVDAQLLAMKVNFVDKGIPVIIGEFSAQRRTTPMDLAKHNASVNYWHRYVTQKSIANGLVPFLWETGSIIDRTTFAVKDPTLLDGILESAGKK